MVLEEAELLLMVVKYAVGYEWYERMKKILHLGSEIHAFLDGVIECIFWKGLEICVVLH